MFEMPVVNNSILPCQEAFLVDAPTPNTSPHRWIQAKTKTRPSLLAGRSDVAHISAAGGPVDTRRTASAALIQ